MAKFRGQETQKSSNMTVLIPNRHMPVSNRKAKKLERRRRALENQRYRQPAFAT